MSAGRLTARITAYRSQDGWRSGYAELSDGRRHEFFLSPSGELRLYAEERATRGCNRLDPFGRFAQRRRRAVREALAAIPTGTAPW